MQHSINRSKREGSSKAPLYNFFQSLFSSQYFELVTGVVYRDGVIDIFNI